MQRRNFVLIFFSFDTEIKGCMTTMYIDNHPLTQRRLQFIGICVNKSNLSIILAALFCNFDNLSILAVDVDPK